MGAFVMSVLNPAIRSPLFAFGTCGVLAWAVRPLAASAPLADFEATDGCARSGRSSSLQSVRLNAVYSTPLVFAGSLPLGRKPGVAQALRMRARQRPQGRANTRCFAARAGELRLFACGASQRKMQCRAMPCAPPNPSIERTRPGKPGRASHVKR
jgi:hypothetical protein